MSGRRNDNTAQTAVTPPRQVRSRATLDRIVGAVRELLDQRHFDDITVNQIVKGAGTSVGAFYARFRDKESLLDYLAAQMVEELSAEVEALAHRLDRSMEKSIEAMVEGLVKHHRRHRGVLRAIVLRGMGARGASRVLAAFDAAGPLPPLVEEMKTRRREINHPNPETAVGLGMSMAVSTIRERILFPELNPMSAGDIPITDAVLVAELTRSLVAFLGVNTAVERG